MSSALVFQEEHSGLSVKQKRGSLPIAIGGLEFRPSSPPYWIQTSSFSLGANSRAKPFGLIVSQALEQERCNK